MKKVKTKDIYYSKQTMEICESSISNVLNKYVRNYSREEVAAEFDLKGEVCLDIACGDGELSNSFLSKKYKHVVGVDISNKLIEKAKSSKVKNCEFYAEDIDLFVERSIKSGKKYDSVYLLAILEHIQWPSIFIESINKIVKKGGHVIIEVPNVAWLPHRLSLLGGKFPITAPTTGVIAGVYDEHIRFFTHNTLNRVVQDAGFELVKLDCSGKFRELKRIYLELFSPDIVALYKRVS